MMINHIMCTSKILTDLCLIKQKIKTKNGFVEVVYSVLVVKVFVLMIGLVSKLLFLEVKMLLMNLLKQFLKSMSTVKK